MSQRSPASSSGPSLFRQCADFPDNGDSWREFVRRYTPLLARSVARAWQKCGQGNWPPPEVSQDLLQDVFLAIVKNDFALLQHFRGTTEEEANAYLARTAINETINFLRAKGRLRRKVEEISLEALIEDEGEEGRLPLHLNTRRHSLTEQELIEILEQCFAGPNSNRDVLIFLLHFRDGYSTSEIAKMGFSTLKVSSLNNLLGELKKRLRKFFTDNM
ncbi:MAG: sigma-70 family RNA polymerase sigma factor [Acidobacteria bacterium]|nr:sigma-70 family RNA polymerase sigma factor [Acidobacteriota bacterium]